MKHWTSSSRRLGALALTSMLALSLTGCPDEGISESDYISRTATDICDLLFSCQCEVDEDLSQAECVDLWLQQGEVISQVTAIDGLSFDGVCAEDNLSQLQDRACDDGFDPGAADAACEQPCKVYYGPMKAGESCSAGTAGIDNCAQGLVCNGGVCENPCDELVPAKVGELCYALNCEDGAYCDANDPYAPVCKADPTFNSPCVDLANDPDYPNFYCGENLVCDVDAEGGTPLCVTLPLEGDPCPDFDCADGLFCDVLLAEPVCTAYPGLNEPCTDQGFCDFTQGLQCDPEYCPAGSDCDADPSLIVPTCVQGDPAVCNLEPPPAF